MVLENKKKTFFEEVKFYWVLVIFLLTTNNPRRPTSCIFVKFCLGIFVQQWKSNIITYYQKNLKLPFPLSSTHIAFDETVGIAIQHHWVAGLYVGNLPLQKHSLLSSSPKEILKERRSFTVRALFCCSRDSESPVMAKLFWLTKKKLLFIEPRSDHSLLMSVTNWLTHWLTDKLVEDWMNKPKYAEYADYAD